MAKFWYRLKNEKDNLTVTLGKKHSVTFSKRFAGNTELLLEESPVLDGLVKAGQLEKLTDAEKKAKLNKAAKTAQVPEKEEKPAPAQASAPAPAPASAAVKEEKKSDIDSADSKKNDNKSSKKDK